MAQLKDLIVNGTTRLIGKLFTTDIQTTTINGQNVGDTPKFTDTVYTHPSDGGNTGTFGSATQVPKITVNSAGHVTAVTATTITDNNQTIKGNGTTFSANDAIDIVAGSNVTVTADATTKKITIASTDTNTHNSHAIISGLKADGATNIQGSASSGNITIGDSGVTAGEYGPTADQTPAYGATFNVPDIKINAKGIVTSATNRTVKIPASDNTDTKVTSAFSTTNADEPILLNNGTSATTNTVLMKSGATINPNTGNLKITQINGVTVGSSPKFTDTVTTVTATGSGNAITALTASNGALTATKGTTFATVTLNKWS